MEGIIQQSNNKQSRDRLAHQNNKASPTPGDVGEPSRFAPKNPGSEIEPQIPGMWFVNGRFCDGSFCCKIVLRLGEYRALQECNLSAPIVFGLHKHPALGVSKHRESFFGYLCKP